MHNMTRPLPVKNTLQEDGLCILAVVADLAHATSLSL